jgi:hypothetical protein
MWEIFWVGIRNWTPGRGDASKWLLIGDTEYWGAGVFVMSSLSAAAVATPVAGEGQVKGDQNGGSAPLVQQLEMSVANPSNPGSVVLRDTSSIPGVSMYARQCYPSTVFKHEEVVANKEIFFEALNKFHTVLGTRLTYGSFLSRLSLFWLPSCICNSIVGSEKLLCIELSHP